MVNESLHNYIIEVTNTIIKITISYFDKNINKKGPQIEAPKK